MIVKIYVLIDPFTLRIRYIGRTSVDLKSRLSHHIHTSKKIVGNGTHKQNWIRSLIKKNSKPHIRLLTTVEGWTESHQEERCLIAKYKDRLVNAYDRGEGGHNRTVSNKLRKQISKTLTRLYRDKIVPHPRNKQVHVYSFIGEYLSSYESAKEAGAAIAVYPESIGKYFRGEIKQLKKYQFSRKKVKRMPDLSLLPYRRQRLITLRNSKGEILTFNSVRDCKSFFKLTQQFCSTRNLMRVLWNNYGDEYEIKIKNTYYKHKQLIK